VLLALVAAVVVLVVEATSNGSQSRRATAHQAGTKPQGASAPSGGPFRQSGTTGAARTRTDPLEASAVRQVLAYTPFITGGVPTHRVIALTFDDGPSPYTARIVSELARLHVPATFFVVGQQLNDFSAGLRDELKHGFAIGDHTENHSEMTRLSAAAQYKEIHDDAVRIERLGAPAPLLYRPPYGLYNSATLAVLKRMGMLMTLWAVDTRDWERPGTAAIIRGALSAARPGAIVLMHDGGGDRSQTVAALPAIVKALKRRHYGFVTVPQLLRLDPPPRGQRLPHVAE
jgi:peptidoglycan/xylan/chitin deacetylase (PgdA/CDA1 family)